MGPAIALRLRQHLTLTPQVQQALRLLQMSALEFAQEMEEALSQNPFLEENAQADGSPAADAKAEAEPPPPDLEGRLPQEAGSSAPDRDRDDDWSGAADVSPTLQEHLRQQLLISPMSERDRALAHMIVDSLDDDGYFKMAFEELAALLPAEAEVLPEELQASLRLVQSLDPSGVGARNLEECLLLQLQALDPGTPGRSCAMSIVRGHLPLLANREWSRLQHAVGCDEASLQAARALIRSLDPKPGHRFGPQEARYVVPDVLPSRAERPRPAVRDETSGRACA